MRAALPFLILLTSTTAAAQGIPSTVEVLPEGDRTLWENPEPVFGVQCARLYNGPVAVHPGQMGVPQSTGDVDYWATFSQPSVITDPRGCNNPAPTIPADPPMQTALTEGFNWQTDQWGQILHPDHWSLNGRFAITNCQNDCHLWVNDEAMTYNANAIGQVGQDFPGDTATFEVALYAPPYGGYEYFPFFYLHYYAAGAWWEKGISIFTWEGSVDFYGDNHVGSISGFQRETWYKARVSIKTTATGTNGKLDLNTEAGVPVGSTGWQTLSNHVMTHISSVRLWAGRFASYDDVLVAGEFGPFQPPSAPQNLEANWRTEPGNVILTWDAPGYTSKLVVQRYTVYRTNVEGRIDVLQAGSQRRFVDTPPPGVYTYRVSATTMAGEGPDSLPASALSAGHVPVSLFAPPPGSYRVGYADGFWAHLAPESSATVIGPDGRSVTVHYDPFAVSSDAVAFARDPVGRGTECTYSPSANSCANPVVVHVGLDGSFIDAHDAGNPKWSIPSERFVVEGSLIGTPAEGTFTLLAGQSVLRVPSGMLLRVGTKSFLTAAGTEPYVAEWGSLAQGAALVRTWNWHAQLPNIGYRAEATSYAHPYESPLAARVYPVA